MSKYENLTDLELLDRIKTECWLTGFVIGSLSGALLIYFLMN